MMHLILLMEATFSHFLAGYFSSDSFPSIEYIISKSQSLPNVVYFKINNRSLIQIRSP